MLFVSFVVTLSRSQVSKRPTTTITESAYCFCFEAASHPLRCMAWFATVVDPAIATFPPLETGNCLQPRGMTTKDTKSTKRLKLKEDDPVAIQSMGQALLLVHGFQQPLLRCC